MKTLATAVMVVMDLILVGTVVWLACIVTRRQQRCHERIRILELKTGWLHVQEGPGNRVTVEGKLEALCVTGQKDEDTPYAS